MFIAKHNGDVKPHEYIILTLVHLLVSLCEYFNFKAMNNFKMYFHIMRFCSTSCHLLPLCYKFVLSTLFLNTPSLCPSFDVRDVLDFRRMIKCSHLHVPASLRWKSEIASLSFRTFENLRSVNFTVSIFWYVFWQMPTYQVMSKNIELFVSNLRNRRIKILLVCAISI